MLFIASRLAFLSDHCRAKWKWLFQVAYFVVAGTGDLAASDAEIVSADTVVCVFTRDWWFRLVNKLRLSLCP